MKWYENEKRAIWAILILKYKRNRKFDFYNVRSIFVSLMSTKSAILTRGFAIRENTAVGAHSVN